MSAAHGEHPVVPLGTPDSSGIREGRHLRNNLGAVAEQRRAFGMRGLKCDLARGDRWFSVIAANRAGCGIDDMLKGSFPNIIADFNICEVSGVRDQLFGNPVHVRISIVLRKLISRSARAAESVSGPCGQRAALDPP